MEQLILELLNEFADTSDLQPLTQARVDTWVARSGTTAPEVYDAIALVVAKGFDSGDLTYQFCDCVMNLMGSWYWLQMAPRAGTRELGGIHLFRRLFEDVYNCFDAGEFHRQLDNSDDPVAEHTVPMVRALLVPRV
jgi:hypothetical protein